MGRFEKRRRRSRLPARLMVVGLILMFAPLARGSLGSLDFLQGVPVKARDTLQRLADVFGMEQEKSGELNGELVTAFDTFEQIGDRNDRAEKALRDEDPFVVVEKDRWGERVEIGSPSGHRYAPPDFKPELVEAARILRASF